jgi:uncharacterized protein (DUF433 family)
MARLTPRRLHQQLQAALYLGMRPRKLQYWVYDKPMWKVADPTHHVRLLSFRDVAQIYFMEFLRKQMGLSDRKVRDILLQARRISRSHYPLLSKNVKVLLRRVLLDKPARGKSPRRIYDLTQHGQMAIPEVVGQFATRVEWDSRKQVARIFPWKHWTADKANSTKRPVSIDPHVMSGRLVITGTRVPVQTVLSRKLAGESVPHLSKDYQVPEQTIVDALRHLGLQQAA